MFLPDPTVMNVSAGDTTETVLDRPGLPENFPEGSAGAPAPAEPAATFQASKPGKTRRRLLGKVLIDANAITPEQLDTALARQGSRGTPLGQTLVDLGFLDEHSLAAALAKQLSMPLADLRTLTIDQAVLGILPRTFALGKNILPFHLEDNALSVAFSEPLEWPTIDDIAFATGLKIRPYVAARATLRHKIDELYARSETLADMFDSFADPRGLEFVNNEEEQDIDFAAMQKTVAAAPIVRAVNGILVEAIEAGASDVHIEGGERSIAVRYRIDGVLITKMNLPKHVQPGIVARIKILSHLDITQRRLPQDGHLAVRVKGTTVNVRVSTLPTVYGENLVLRILDSRNRRFSMDTTGMPEELSRRLVAAARNPQGMILVTGPTGSGKTTTLYSLISAIYQESRKFVALEDPVEYELEGVTQVSINEAIELSFPAALRSTLRQDPDVVLVGEIRDRDTAEIALKAALTGHLVLATVHTNSTAATLTRMLDIGLPAYLVKSTVTQILAQRLVRRICPHCKTAVPVQDTDTIAHIFALKEVFRGTGCSRCHGTGYRGRVGLFEFLEMNRAIRSLIVPDLSEDAVEEQAREQGMKTLLEDGMEKVAAGLTTLEEVMSVCGPSTLEHIDRYRSGERVPS